MQVICKKTNEITDTEIDAIYELFEDVFHLRRDRKTFRDEYENTPLGYSYHSILFDDNGKVIGFHSVMPFYYYNKEKKFIAGLGIDSMVEKSHRDYFCFHDMIKACQKKLKEDGCVLRIGFPNDNSYPVLKKGLKHKDIGKLNTYFLIKNIGGVKEKLSFLNPFSSLLTRTQLLLSRFSKDDTIYKFRFRKERKSFNKVRYKWFGGDYKFINLGDGEVIYRIKNHEGVDTAFLIDVFPLSKKNFDKAVREIYKMENSHIDMILYVGYLPFTPLSMIKMPHKYEPKHFNFTCFPLVKDAFDESLYDINNWDVNLSNYDLI